MYLPLQKATHKRLLEGPEEDEDQAGPAHVGDGSEDTESEIRPADLPMITVSEAAAAYEAVESMLDDPDFQSSALNVLSRAGSPANDHVDLTVAPDPAVSGILNQPMHTPAL
jgi:hypothetical protein